MSRARKSVAALPQSDRCWILVEADTYARLERRAIVDGITVDELLEEAIKGFLARKGY